MMIYSFKKIIFLNLVFALSAIALFPQNISARENNMHHMGSEMMGKRMMGNHMMGMCPSFGGENVKTNITETSDGVTITYSAKNKKDIARLQKLAKINKLSQELDEEEGQNK